MFLFYFAAGCVEPVHLTPMTYLVRCSCIPGNYPASAIRKIVKRIINVTQQILFIVLQKEQLLLREKKKVLFCKQLSEAVSF